MNGPFIPLSQGNGWKRGESSEESYSLKHLCGFDRGLEALKACVRNKTYTLEETIWVNETQVNVYVNSKSPERVKDHINASAWNTWMTTTMFGFCHTLVYPKPMERLEAMIVILKGDFRVMLHDPNFFVLRYQNFYIPYTLLDQPSGKNYNLVAKTKKRMRRPGKYDCNPELSYNFENCVRTFLAETIGCLSPWDPRPLEGSFEVCNSTSEVERCVANTDLLVWCQKRVLSMRKVISRLVELGRSTSAVSS